jgi:hypothetical protein
VSPEPSIERSRLPSIVVPCLIGVALGLVCAIVSIMLGGAGHGWVSAWPFGLLSLVLFPVALARLRRFRSASIAMTAALFIAGVGLDIALYSATLSEGVGYFRHVQADAIPWLVLWCTWQLAALATVVLSAAARGPQAAR